MLLGKTLYINTENNGASGAAVISDRNYELVSGNSSFIIKYSVNLTLKRVRKNIKSIFLECKLINEFDTKSIIYLIRSNNIDTVFIDTSMLGNIAKEIKNNFPEVYLIAFFHNVEYEYFKELIKVSRKAHHYFTLRLIKKAEIQLIKTSDVVITLNKRDSNGLNRFYGRGADLILPTSFIDDYDKLRFLQKRNTNDELNLLFVGSYFPPNIYGVDWFVDNVFLKIKRKVNFFVVGNGFESHQLKISNESIRLIGRVEDLSSYYYAADLVVAPIFHGSGMKTKVAEALMYNKPIAGTKEAFEGYEINIVDVGKECNTSDEFINYIENFTNKQQDIRTLFLSNYSFETIKNNFHKFLNDTRK